MSARVRPAAVVSYLLLALGAVAMLFPFLWMVLTSFKDAREIFGLNFLPQTWTLENYREVIFANRFSPLVSQQRHRRRLNDGFCTLFLLASWLYARADAVSR